MVKKRKASRLSKKDIRLLESGEVARPLTAKQKRKNRRKKKGRKQPSWFKQQHKIGSILRFTFLSQIYEGELIDVKPINAHEPGKHPLAYKIKCNVDGFIYPIGVDGSSRWGNVTEVISEPKRNKRRKK